MSGYYQSFGLCTFFTYLTTYVVNDTSLSLYQAVEGSVALGATSVVGVVAISVTYYMEYDRLIPLAITPLVCGATAMFITFVENEVSVTRS